ncbi:MAG: CopD family protein [Dongiaceae bacterium]
MAHLRCFFGAPYAYLWTLVPKGLADVVGRRLHVFRAASNVVAVATTAAALPLETGVVGTGVALRRFSTAGHIAVMLVIASGVINTILILGRWPIDWSSPYQALIACKIAVVVVMVGLAIVNRYGLVPGLSRQRPDALRAIQLGTIAEITLGLCAVGLVSVFGMLEPS